MLLRLGSELTGSWTAAVLTGIVLILYTPRTMAFPTVITSYLGTRSLATAITFTALLLAARGRPWLHAWWQRSPGT